MRKPSKFNDLQEEEGPRFKSLYFKKEHKLIEASSYSLSHDQLQLTLKDKYGGTLTLGPDNTTVTESNDCHRLQQIEIAIEDDTVFVLLDDEKCHECTKIKYPFDSEFEHPQILYRKSKEYIEISMDRAF